MFSTGDLSSAIHSLQFKVTRQKRGDSGSERRLFPQPRACFLKDTQQTHAVHNLLRTHRLYKRTDCDVTLFEPQVNVFGWFPFLQNPSRQIRQKRQTERVEERKKTECIQTWCKHFLQQVIWHRFCSRRDFVVQYACYTLSVHASPRDRAPQWEFMSKKVKGWQAQ